MKTTITRLYLSGAISEDPDYMTKFQNADLQLRSKGFNVINPVALGHIDKAGANIDDSWELHLMRDICAMLGYGITAESCQGIAIIPYKNIIPWKNKKSKGADLECYIAKKLDLYIMTVDKWLEWTGDKYSEPPYILTK
jgi:hypothetical protein